MNTFHTFDPSVLVGFQNGTLVGSLWLTQSTWLWGDPWWPTRHPRNLSKASATRIPSWMDSWDVCSLAKLRSSQITPPDQSWNVLDHVTMWQWLVLFSFRRFPKACWFLCGLGGFHISSVAWIWPSRSIWAADWSLLPSKRAAVGRWIACGLRRPSPRLQPIWVCSFRGAMADVIIRYVVSAHVFGQGWLRMTWASSIVNGGTSCYLSGWAHDLSCTQFVTMVGLGSVMVGPYLSGRIQSHVYLEDLKTLDVSKCHAVFLKWWSTEVLRQGLQGLIDGSTKVAGLWFNVTVDTSMIV